MSEIKHYISVDLGAESGRVMLGSIDGERMELTEIHRFSNGPTKVDGSLRWDFSRLLNEIRTGLSKAYSVQQDISSIGVDTWGVDFGLIDESGMLIENPFHYRDSRTQGMLQEAIDELGADALYENTGIQFMEINSLYQFMAVHEQQPDIVARAKHLLFMPNLIMYEMTGNVSAEYTIASTSQMMDMRTGQWSDTVLDGLGLNTELLPDIIHPGQVVGTLCGEWADAVGGRKIPVVAVGTHDTASAVAGVPADMSTNWAYLSSGTWSLIGIETPRAVINEQSCKLSYTNEGGIGNTIRFLKNIVGLWLVQECKREWQRNGTEYDYTTLTQMAQEAPAFQACLDVDHEPFIAPGEMPAKINEWLKSSGQPECSKPGEMVRMILEGLALRYDGALRDIEAMTGQAIDVLHIVGGGIQNKLLNQLAADATGKKVVTGPIEATVAGSILVQAMAAGQIASLNDGRALVSRSFKVETYKPSNKKDWDAFRKKFASIKAN